MECPDRAQLCTAGGLTGILPRILLLSLASADSSRPGDAVQGAPLRASQRVERYRGHARRGHGGPRGGCLPAQRDRPRHLHRLRKVRSAISLRCSAATSGLEALAMPAVMIVDTWKYVAMSALSGPPSV